MKKLVFREVTGVNGSVSSKIILACRGAAKQRLYCPYSGGGNPRQCGDWCAIFDVEDDNTVLCGGEVIGKLEA